MLSKASVSIGSGDDISELISLGWILIYPGKFIPHYYFEGILEPAAIEAESVTLISS